MGFTLFFLLLAVATAVASPPNQIHLIMPHSGAGGHKLAGINCLSWRLAVETNNLRNWTEIPKWCRAYVGDYMLSKQYRKDCELVADEAFEYAKGLNITGDGKDVWVFDIDETTLSNVPFFARGDVAFGPINATLFNAWLLEAKGPAIRSSLKLYKKLIRLGFKIVFLTATDEAYGEARAKNLKTVGYKTWEKLILRGADEEAGVAFKSGKRKELEDGGYKIWGNMGDQWSDLLGSNPGDRTLKMPNPMYYVA